MRKERRREEIKKLVQQGYEDRKAGKSCESFPNSLPHMMDRMHWLKGWHTADAELTIKSWQVPTDDREINVDDWLPKN